MQNLKMYKIYFSYFFYIINLYHITSLLQQIFFSKICLPDCSISKIKTCNLAPIWGQGVIEHVSRHKVLSSNL